MIPGILFAAASSGCGKTTITCGALRAWQRKGLKVKAWKCGPDYIDPMFHKQVLGIPGGNPGCSGCCKGASAGGLQSGNR